MNLEPEYQCYVRQETSSTAPDKEHQWVFCGEEALLDPFLASATQMN